MNALAGFDSRVHNPHPKAARRDQYGAGTGFENRRLGGGSLR